MLALTHSDIGKLICAHTGQRVSLRTDEIQQHFDFAHAILAQLEAVEGVSTLPSTPLPGEALQGGEQDVFFTAVYRVPKKHSAEFASEVCASAFWSAASWSHALDERDAARAALQQPVQAAPDDSEILLAAMRRAVLPLAHAANAIKFYRPGYFDLDAAIAAAVERRAGAPGEPGQ